MPLTAMSKQLKYDALNAWLNGKTVKMLLIKVGATGTYDGTLTNVGTPGTGTPSATNVGTDEASGTGYTSGGATLAGQTIANSGAAAIVDYTSPVTWANATLSAICGVIYEAASKNVIGIVDFGGTISSTAAPFTVNLPASGAASSLVRFP